MFQIPKTVIQIGNIHCDIPCRDTNAKDYARGAKYVIKNGTYIPEKNAYIRFLGSQGKANYAFVGMKAGGRVSTYHVRSVSKMVKDGVSIFSL